MDFLNVSADEKHAMDVISPSEERLKTHAADEVEDNDDDDDD
jgi:hypothetical protein